MLKLNLQYTGHLMGRTDLVEKSPVLGKIKARRQRGIQKMKFLGGNKLQKFLMDREV